jgi:hypothetical protein
MGKIVDFRLQMWDVRCEITIYRLLLTAHRLPGHYVLRE